MSYSINNMRLTGVDKEYYKYQLKQFAEHFVNNKIKSVAFGKQDIRGGFSITFFDHNHCVPKQRHFQNKAEMLGFIIGFNSATNDSGII